MSDPASQSDGSKQVPSRAFIEAPTTVIVPFGEPVPPPRPGVRHVHLVTVGVIVADDPLRKRIDRLFHWPMIIVGLLVLPLLAIEYFLRPAAGTVWANLALTGIILISFAFLVEFVIKIAIAESRVEYAKRNWLDIIIIAIPFLRPLRLATIAKSSRVFTMRGVGIKAARYVVTILVGLEATERLLHRMGIKARDGRTDPDQMTRHQLTRELRELRRLTDDWETWYETHREYVRTHGGEDLYDEPAPRLAAADPSGDDARPEQDVPDGVAESDDP